MSFPEAEYSGWMFQGCALFLWRATNRRCSYPVTACFQNETETKAKKNPHKKPPVTCCNFIPSLLYICMCIYQATWSCKSSESSRQSCVMRLAAGSMLLCGGRCEHPLGWATAEPKPNNLSVHCNCGAKQCLQLLPCYSNMSMQLQSIRVWKETETETEKEN